MAYNYRNVYLKLRTMKKSIISTSFILIVTCIVLASCSRGITIHEAANGKAKCGRYIK